MRIIITLLLSLFALTSCVNEPTYSSDELEARSLKAWMKKNHPELIGNYQENGGYYVHVLSWGDEVAATEESTTEKVIDLGNQPIMDQDTCWVYYNFTGYNLDGSVFSTRDEIIARMQATFSDRTHYVPYGNFCGKEEFYAIVEGSYLASRNKIKLSEEYVAANSGVCKGTELILRKGSKVRLYMPSTIAYSSSGSSAEGGYEGQYSLDSNVPMILDMEVMRVVSNPSDVELEMVEELVKKSNSQSEQIQWHQIENTENEDGDDSDDANPEGDIDVPETDEDTDTEKKYYEGIYYNNTFKPDEEYAHLKYATPDKAGFDNPYRDSQRYANMAEFDKELWKILDEKFEKMIKKTSEADAKEVTEDNSAMIWYVGRFLDGFIFDTNIPEVRKLAFNEDGSDDESSSGSSAISYSVSSNKDEYISAWAHAVPHLRYGRWGAVITTSGYAYGSSGVSASTSSTSTSSAAAYNSLMNLYN
ncbi:MAG: hypothetical protein IIV68_00485, partial [Alistipes sp.]|nr:hypothetical protein [Alistipes sp.]